MEEENKIVEEPVAPVEEEKKNEKMEEVKEEVKEKAAEFADAAKAKAAEFKEKVKEAEAAGAEEVVCDAEDISANKAMAILAYFGILVLIPIFAAKESKFARFHANQGLLLFICCMICVILGYIPIVKWFVWIIDIAIFVFAIMGIVNAAKGEVKQLPIIGKYKILK